ncbi:hypothetical protein [Romboutsia sp.]|uniref:hypothetical protein n=1 Tax=Romboutsia sp. TaxID=1965302 RepID=UPI002CBBC517|nr:hypothetical protein [Romboutsia sp.]HSQ89777.1 hypothetical protein [Romboutsia sp.]
MKKKLLAGMLMAVTMFSLVGCYAPEVGSEAEMNAKQNQLLQESNRQIGMPNIKNNFEKKVAKDIWELRDNPDLTTYAYTQNMDGRYVYLGRCIGYGLPYTTQYTSPEKVWGGYYANEGEHEGGGDGLSYAEDVVLPQADPNGLYSSETTNATWLVLINEETNEREIIYSEPSIVVTQTKLPKRLVADWSLPNNY